MNGKLLSSRSSTLYGGRKRLISCASSSSASASVRVVTMVIDRVCETIRCSRFGSLRDLGVVGDPALQRPRLADIEHVAAGILHAVDARARRKRLQHLADRRDARFEVGQRPRRARHRSPDPR